MRNFDFTDKFVNRHIGPNNAELEIMLNAIGVTTLDALIDQTVPETIYNKEKIKLSDALSEYEFLNKLKLLSQKNRVFKNYIGLGYYPTITPSVIKRNILENPGWYTQYTPYQAEISQGRLEALLNFQTMIVDLTAMPIANASLLDEATAAAEAMMMFFALRKGNRKNANKFLVSDKVFSYTIDVLKTRSEPFGIELDICKIDESKFTEDVFGFIVQYPNLDGEVLDYSGLFSSAAQKGILKVVAADLLSLTILKAPGEFGADAVIGSTQRFGIPMGFGGPHAAYFATKDEFKRQIPGRIIGVTIDAKGNRALRMALQTREQHIKREHATSNICTAQVLLAIMAGMYAAYHGPQGIKAIAQRINALTCYLENGLKTIGVSQINGTFFDTLKIQLTDKAQLELLRSIAENQKINLRFIDETKVGISISETDTINDVNKILEVIAAAVNKGFDSVNKPALNGSSSIPKQLERSSEYLTHPVFNSYHSETEMMRYIKSLENKDLSLTASMIPLGSCTMKLNAASELFGIGWNEFADIHPFVPLTQAEGYLELINEIESDLAKITGFSAVSLQPNSGAQGEYAGLMVIRAYHLDRGEKHRNVVLIPSSAHGTNPASAVLAGNKVVVVKCDVNGNVDLAELKQKAEQYNVTLAGLMVTYPSTHGVFEEGIREMCEIIHANGGLVYMDGANLNAQLGLTSPGFIGADVCHLNLHKTFAIPHGGGGPGVGPIAVNEKLKPFLPGHQIHKVGGAKSISAVSSAPWGSALVLLISYGYIKMMGIEGLTAATKYAILNANYIKAKLEKDYPVLYKGKNGFVAHELIFDMRSLKTSANIEVDDIAKRLMDYGFHAPTVSFPVPGTIMVEPTESECLRELDRFVEAMLLIRKEIAEIESGAANREDNILKNAPHTAALVTSDDWNCAYNRKRAAFPTAHTMTNKFWPSVSRVNNAYGDRNLVCSCVPISEYVEENK